MFFGEESRDVTLIILLWVLIKKSGRLIIL